MSHTAVDLRLVKPMSESKNPNAGDAVQLSYAQALARLIADPNTSYLLRRRIKEDELLGDASKALQDAQLLARLAQLRLEEASGQCEDRATVLHTAQEHTDAFRQANAIVALEGYQATPDDLALQQRVITGELSADQAVQEIIRRARTGSGK